MSGEPEAKTSERAAPRPSATAASLRRDYLTSSVNHTFFAHLFKAVFKQHHRVLLPLLRPLIPRDAIVLDVGAHAGQFAKLFARLAPEGFVIAVEPGSYARLILRAALLFNRIRNVAVLPMALGERAGVATLTMPVKRAGSFGFGLSHLGPSDRAGAVRAEVVAVATLDEIAASLGLKRLDFIKADVEGWELQLLRGGRNTLARFKPTLLLEMNAAQLARAGDTIAEAWRFLGELGYVPHRATENGGLARVTEQRGGDIWWLATTAREPNDKPATV